MSNRIQLRMYLGNGPENHFSYYPKYSGNVVVECGYPGAQTGMEIKKKFFKKYFENKTYDDELIEVIMHNSALDLFKIDCPNATTLLFIKEKSLKKIELADDENINEGYYEYIQKYHEGTEFASQVNCMNISKLYMIKYCNTKKHFIFSDDMTLDTCIEFMEDNGIIFLSNNIKINNIPLNMHSTFRDSGALYASVNEINSFPIIENNNMNDRSQINDNANGINNDLLLHIKNMDVKINILNDAVRILYDMTGNMTGSLETVKENLTMAKDERNKIMILLEKMHKIICKSKSFLNIFKW